MKTDSLATTSVKVEKMVKVLPVKDEKMVEMIKTHRCAPDFDHTFCKASFNDSPPRTEWELWRILRGTAGNRGASNSAQQIKSWQQSSLRVHRSHAFSGCYVRTVQYMKLRYCTYLPVIQQLPMGGAEAARRCKQRSCCRGFSGRAYAAHCEYLYFYLRTVHVRTVQTAYQYCTYVSIY